MLDGSLLQPLSAARAGYDSCRETGPPGTARGTNPPPQKWRGTLPWDVRAAGRARLLRLPVCEHRIYVVGQWSPSVAVMSASMLLQRRASLHLLHQLLWLLLFEALEGIPLPGERCLPQQQGRLL